MSQSNLSTNEVELYRLLEHAKLGQYFTNFLIKGGDDVSQLAEATKEEFDEIIDMVGMMQKPLHIRRLQKALKEWSKDSSAILSLTTEIIVPQSAKPYLKANQNLVSRDKGIKTENECFSQNNDDLHTVSNNIFMSQPLLSFTDDEKDMHFSGSTNMMNLPPIFNNHVFQSPSNGRIKPIENANGIPVSMLPNAVLTNYEKSKIKLAAENLAHTLPVIETRLSSTGRKDVNKGVMNILSMSKEDPERETQIYNYSAIYGRFNAPRRTGKPMNHHEVSVNEAAAQLSLQIPELITRRDNLFHLARQVVKMAEEIQDDNFLVPKLEPKKECNTVLENMQMEEMEKQISDIKNEIGTLMIQEGSIRDSYREAKQNNQGLLMNELQKRLDDTLNQLNNKFTEQTSLATKIMLLKAGIMFGTDGKTRDTPVIKTEPNWSMSSGQCQNSPAAVWSMNTNLSQNTQSAIFSLNVHPSPNAPSTIWSLNAATVQNSPTIGWSVNPTAINSSAQAWSSNPAPAQNSPAPAWPSNPAPDPMSSSPVWPVNGAANHQSPSTTWSTQDPNPPWPLNGSQDQNPLSTGWSLSATTNQNAPSSLSLHSSGEDSNFEEESKLN